MRAWAASPDTVPVPQGLSTHRHPNHVPSTSCGQGTSFWCFSNLMIKIENCSIFLKLRQLHQIHTHLSFQNSTSQSQPGSLGWLQQLWAHFRVGSRIAPKTTGFMKKSCSISTHIWLPSGLLYQQGILIIILHHTHLAVPTFHTSITLGTHPSSSRARGHCIKLHGLCGLVST